MDRPVHQQRQRCFKPIHQYWNASLNRIYLYRDWLFISVRRNDEGEKLARRFTSEKSDPSSFLFEAIDMQCNSLDAFRSVRLSCRYPTPITLSLWAHPQCRYPKTTWWLEQKPRRHVPFIDTNSTYLEYPDVRNPWYSTTHSIRSYCNDDDSSSLHQTWRTTKFRKAWSNKRLTILFQVSRASDYRRDRCADWHQSVQYFSSKQAPFLILGPVPLLKIIMPLRELLIVWAEHALFWAIFQRRMALSWSNGFSYIRGYICIFEYRPGICWYNVHYACFRSRSFLWIHIHSFTVSAQMCACWMR